MQAAPRTPPWLCRCGYRNAATPRCSGCRRKAPRDLRREWVAAASRRAEHPTEGPQTALAAQLLAREASRAT
ncbi:MAG: hypothetical protein ACYDAD_13255 [Acidimicrobiales bacterium]